MTHRTSRILAAGLATAGVMGASVALAPTSSAALPGVPSAASARTMLGKLHVAPGHSMSGYSRAQFPHWSPVDGRCDARETVLKRDGSGVEAGADCHVTAGTWHSVYDGRTVTDPGLVDIDHMVPLAQAWRSGADGWTSDRREQFANDVTRPQLVAVSRESNRSKGDQDPAQWMPTATGYSCTYAEAWVQVKSHWGLEMDQAEKDALTNTLGGCR